MINRLSLYVTKETQPYKNLALEEYFIDSISRDECILYLWQNRNTVVIGKNQNAWAECKVSELENSDGFLARRSSGGGAVYHDLGNLNFTFVATAENYDVDKQLSVIIDAVNNLGICAEKSGRNDITVDGKKISGNAFSRKGDKCCHHGTIMFNVDIENLTKYLNVSALKLSSKGITSVKSRCCNLKDYADDLTLEKLIIGLTESFSKIYCLPVDKKDESYINQSEVETLHDKYSSWEWNFGSKIPFTSENTKRFDWGEVTLLLNVNKGIVLEAQAFSDAMDSDFISKLPSIIINCKFSSEVIAKRIEQEIWESNLQKELAKDVSEWILQIF